MKLLTTVVALSILGLASFSADAGNRGKLVISNDAKNSVAAGGEVLAASASDDAFGSNQSLLYMAGQRAHAGSVIVNGCPCRKKTVVRNKSRNAMAIGAASAGSVVLNAGYGY